MLIGGAIYYVSPFSALRAGLAPTFLLQSTYSTRKCTRQVKSYFLEADKLLLRSIARHQQRPVGREEQEAELAWGRRSPGLLCVL